jgi:hypothetical protein
MEVAGNKTVNQLTAENMNPLKNKFPTIAIALWLSVIAVSFKSKPFAFDGGTIHTPYITLTEAGVPVILTATSALGCAGDITYQWQQSIDNANFIDMANATDSSYQSGPIMATTYFRRKATCAGTEVAYTNNVATVTVQAQ